MAQDEGNFPPKAPKFDTAHLAVYWAEHCDYSLLTPKPKAFHDQLQALSQDYNITLIAFSNGPRLYVKKVLERLGLWDLFGEERLYAVDDVLPHCKPQAEAFQLILRNIGNPDPTTCLMVEDSMKNIRGAKALGMKTLLITGRAEEGRILPEDMPQASDPAVDASIATIEEMPTALSGLWNSPALLGP